MEKVRRKNSRHYIDNMSIKNSFVFYALISLVIGIVIGVISITLVDDYRINLNYKYEDMTTRYDIPENGSFTAKYNKDQTEYRLEDIEIEKENINFDFLLKTLSNTTEMLCSDIEYTIKTNCNKQQTLFINLEIIIQIYENLLSNSIRYAKSMIAIDVNKQEEFLLITVSDDGCGFKSTDIERVTLPFYKPSQDTTSEHLGLGLNICKILCERHGGTIKISNNHKGGACVTACIKIAYVDEK